jgi:hypothetical protein
MSSAPLYFDPVAHQRSASTAAAIEQARQQRAAVRAQNPTAPTNTSSDVFIIVDGGNGAGECPASPSMSSVSQSPALPHSPVMLAQPPPYSPSPVAPSCMPQSPVPASLFVPPMSPYAAAYPPQAYGAAYPAPAPLVGAPYYAPAIAAQAAAAAARDADAARVAGVVTECRPDARSSSCLWPWIILFIVLILLAVLAWRYFTHHHHNDGHKHHRDGSGAEASNQERADSVRSMLDSAVPPPASWTRLAERASPGRFSTTRAIFID